MTALALVACGTAGAEPTATGAPATEHATSPEGGASAALRPGMPSTWKVLPTIAAAAQTAAKAEGVTVDGAQAWGDAAIGCYAVRVALHGGSDGADALAEQVLASLRAAQLTMRDVIKPTGPQGALTLGFATTTYQGRLRAELGNGRVAALACFGNQREPATCDATCARVLGTAP